MGTRKKAAGYFIAKRRDAYARAFAALPASEINKIPGPDALEMAEVSQWKARYGIKMETLINGQPETVGSWLIFRKDNDGLWKIVFF